MTCVISSVGACRRMLGITAKRSPKQTSQGGSVSLKKVYAMLETIQATLEEMKSGAGACS